MGISRTKFKIPHLKELIISFFLLLVIIALLVFLYVWKPWQPVDRQSLMPIVPKEQQSLTSAEKYSQYSFYDVLPTRHITPLSESGEKLVADTETKATYYRLYIGAFETEVEAEQMRSKVELNGVTAHVVSFTEQARVRYRVEVGSFADEQVAKQIQQSLITSGINSVTMMQSNE